MAIARFRMHVLRSSILGFLGASVTEVAPLRMPSIGQTVDRTHRLLNPLPADQVEALQNMNNSFTADMPELYTVAPNLQ